MMMKVRIACLLPIVTLLLMGSCQEIEKQPNIIYILADDLGYGDPSCYGQEHFKTPNLDKLAAGGMMFTQHYSGSTVCAPSRSTIMTGLHTGHTPIRGNRELPGEGQNPIPADYFTLAEMLKEAGYATGAFGKWGLGYPGSEGDPNMQGFDEFFGYNCQRMAHRYYPEYLWHNQEKYYLEGNDWTNTVTYAPDVIQQKTMEFIEEHKDGPFFAYVPMVIPHAELIAPNDEIFQSFLGIFEETPHDGGDGADYGPDMQIPKYCSQPYPRATFAAMVSRLDLHVGQIMEKLEELGIAENTIVMFASDNGPHIEGGADPAFFNSSGGLRGVKRDLYEGGIRTAFIASWPGKIVPGSTSDHISAFWDLYPTFADIAGAEMGSEIDGISFLPSLTGQDRQEEHKYLYWEFSSRGGRQAVRMGKWKAVLYNLNRGGELELYDLEADRVEANDIAASHPEIIEKIQSILDEAHTDSELFPLYKNK